MDKNKELEKYFISEEQTSFSLSAIISLEDRIKKLEWELEELKAKSKNK